VVTATDSNPSIICSSLRAQVRILLVSLILGLAEGHFLLRTRYVSERSAFTSLWYPLLASCRSHGIQLSQAIGGNGGNSHSASSRDHCHVLIEASSRELAHPGLHFTIAPSAVTKAVAETRIHAGQGRLPVTSAGERFAHNPSLLTVTLGVGIPLLR
jgi:hypothetical protein